MPVYITVTISQVVKKICGVIEVAVNIVFIGFMFKLECFKLFFKRFDPGFVRFELLVDNSANDEACNKCENSS